MPPGLGRAGALHLDLQNTKEARGQGVGGIAPPPLGQPAAQGDDAPGSTSRHSQAMPDAWRGRVSAAELTALRRGFAAASLPWYNHDDDW